MPLKDDLKKSLVEAAKAKDQVWLDTIRSIQSAVRYKEIEKKGELVEAEILSVIASLCKQRRESVEQFQKGGRQDLADKETRELSLLQKFLPAQLSREEIEKVVRRVVGEIGGHLGIADMGRVMKAVMKDLAGKADGREINEVVRSVLN